MRGPVINILFVLLMIATIIGIDFAFFRGRLWPRLLVNVAIVLTFAAIFLAFLRRP